MAMALQAKPIVAWQQRSHFQMNISILQWTGTFSEMRLLPNYKNWNELHVLAGQVILCPGNPDVDNAAHQVLVEHKYSRARFEEPKTGIMRKYWKVLE
jgi:hypothetical protein